MSESLLRFRNVEAIPLIHGEVAFAVEVRRRMLATRHAVIAVELPPSLERFVMDGVERLPLIHAVVYRERDFDEPVAWSPEREADRDETSRRAWYVPIDPCDGIVEALRVARGERIPVRFVDAEIEQFAGRTLALPDAHAVAGIGVERYLEAVREPLRRLHPMSAEDDARERHMAHELARIARRAGDRPVLFLCGLAHWERIRAHMERGTGRRYEGHAPEPSAIEVAPVGHDSLFHVLGEMPLVTWHYERHRAGFALDDFDPSRSLPRILSTARRILGEQFPRTLDEPSPNALRALLDYARKLTVRAGRLIPDLYTLVVAAKGTVGNDFALSVLEAARTYPPNRMLEGGESPADDLARQLGLDPDAGDREREPPAFGQVPPWVSDLMTESDGSFEPDLDAASDRALETSGGVGRIGEEVASMTPRTPGARRELKRLKLRGPPPERERRLWRTVWNPFTTCSWPPEDVVIENLRAYISNRALAVANLDRVKVEEFTASMKDGLAVRETLRDAVLGKIYVKEEPRVPGRVGAVVMIFEEDDFGAKYPWRLTWMAEHENESTLAFYATDYRSELIGPGVAQAIYGGCMLLFPAQRIPDIWDDLRFERARTPHERLLLAALYYTPDRFVAYVAEKPPLPEVRETAERMGKHVVFLPLSTLSSGTVEKVRRFHVLNGHEVRSWAARFIR